MDKSIISKYDEANLALNNNGVFVADTVKGISAVRTQMSIARKVSGFGKGKQNLLDQNLPITQGVTTFDKMKLPSDKNYVVLGVKVLQSTDVALAVEVANFKAVSSPEIKNGSLAIKQDGQIAKWDIAELTPSSDTNGDVGKDYFECTPFRLQGNSDIEIETAFTGNATDGHSIKVVLDVIEEGNNAKVSQSAC